MSTGLSIPASMATKSKYAETRDIKTLTANRSYLPYIQLMQAGKSENVAGGEYALVVGKEQQNLGSEFLAFFLGYRPKAMQFQPDVKAAYDPSSALFKDIEDRALHVSQSSCGVGVEFLVWLPESKHAALFFFGNETARGEAPNGIAIIQGDERLAQIASRPCINKRKQRWFGPVITPTAAVVEPPNWDFLLPIKEKFDNPPQTSEEKQEKAEDTQDR